MVFYAGKSSCEFYGNKFFGIDKLVIDLIQFTKTLKILLDLKYISHSATTRVCVTYVLFFQVFEVLVE